MELVCPECNLALARRATYAGELWECTTCRGVAAQLSVLRKAIHAPVIERIWARLSEAVRGMRHCPACFKLMVEGPVREKHCLEACPSCQLIWFKAGELGVLPAHQALPVGHAIPPPKPDFAAIRQARYEEAERTPLKPVPAPMYLDAEEPSEGWQYAAGFLGLPVAENAPTERRYFWATWSLLAGMLLAMIQAWGSNGAAVQAWGFVPAEALRHGGLTLLTSFFLHAGILHLLANSYFLLIFGGNVEEALGAWTFLLLVLASTLVGEACHTVLAPDPHVPCVGASGGISGVIAFYALAFPEARIRLCFRSFAFRYFFIGIAVRTAFVLWLLVQGLGAWFQMKGFDHVSYAAHLGGAATGLGFWLIARSRRTAQPA